MFQCPQCQRQLRRHRGPAGPFWACPTCQGHTFTVATLRKVAPRRAVLALWQRAREEGAKAGQRCPSCDRAMREVATPAPSGELPIDVCTGCHLIWFDAGELERLPDTRAEDWTPAPETEETARRRRARQQSAVARARWVGERARKRSEELGGGPPDEVWKWLPAALGWPVEVDAPEVRTWPLVTWTLAAATTVVSMLALGDPVRFWEALGFIPAQAERAGGLTLLSCFLVHGGIVHLVGNMYFFLVFGDNVEDFLGRWRFGLLVVGATLVGNVAHWMADPDSTVPCVGASGGISGVLAFYALQFPRARLSLLFRYYWLFRWLRFRAWVLFAIWILLQLWGTWAQIEGLSNVSALAHLGGVSVGVGFWLILGNRSPGRREALLSSNQ